MILPVVVLVIWTYLLLLRGDFWRVAVPEPLPDAAPAAGIVAVIPARNEAANIGETLGALFAQDYPGCLRVIVVDDHSEDGTAEIARTAAEAAGKADRLTVLGARPLPPGWTGKLWAVSEGLLAAAAFTPDFILLTDADITHAPNNLRQLVARAEAERLDLLSQMVLLQCRTPAERALIPAFVFFFFMLYPPAWAADPTRRSAGAAGGCMLVRPRALERIGGIAAIRGALIDDCALAHEIKTSGGLIRLDVTADTRSSRVYAGFDEIWSMIARTAFTQLGYSSLLLAGTLVGLFVTYLAPLWLALFDHGVARLAGFVAWGAMAYAFQPTLRLYGRFWAWGLALPAIALFYAAATFGSALNYWRGKGGQWKGRAQAVN